MTFSEPAGMSIATFVVELPLTETLVFCALAGPSVGRDRVAGAGADPGERDDTAGARPSA